MSENYYYEEIRYKLNSNEPPTHVFAWDYKKFPDNHSVKCTKLRVFNQFDNLFNGNIRLECKCRSKY